VRVALLAGIGLALLASGGEAEALRHPAAPRCSVFPASNPWNQRVDKLPVAADSDAVVRSIGVGDYVHADFGVKIEGGPNADDDRHAILLDRDRCRLYELFALYPRPGGGWRAGSGAIFDLRSNRLRPAGWTSADAAGLPIFPGLARYDEVKRGRIDHALRFTVSRTRRAYVWPARHFASDLTDPSLPPMGLRLRLKAGFDTRPFPRQARIVLEALKRYGMIVADNGGNWHVTGTPDPRWSNDQLHTLHNVNGSAFEVVDTRSFRP
jgi:hypothetical protein